MLRDWEDFVTFYHYPKEHWIYLWTSNPLESIFSGVGLRTNVAKHLHRWDSALYLVCKIVERLSRHWRPLNGGFKLFFETLASLSLITCCHVAMLILEVIEVANKVRLGLYLKDEEIKRQVKVAAAKRGMTTTAYCAQAIEERLMRDGERSAKDVDRNKIAFLSRMDKFRQEIGPIGMPTAELVEEGRRR